MLKRRPAVALTLMAVMATMLGLAPPAAADHTDPRTPQSSTEGDPTTTFMTRGAGTWDHIRNFKANPGTDLEFFKKGQTLYGTSGTLGQAEAESVGQRIIRLANDGVVDPQFAADHGSAHCETNNPGGTTGLQHDAQITPKSNAQLIIDTTDATGRCHDEAGGGLELIDVSNINNARFKPREIHLTRHFGTSHTVTVDATRPGIVYNSTASFSNQYWIDVLDIRSCLGLAGKTLSAKRAACRPKVFRIPFQENWSKQLNNMTPDDPNDLEDGTAASCHDIYASPGRIYCAALNATLIFDVSGLTNSTGGIKGTPLPCPVVDATGGRTAAKVTDCGQNAEPFNVPNPAQQALGWKFLGTVNHPGRHCNPLPAPPSPKTCNSNTYVRSDQGVAVSHESDPSPNAVGKYMFVTDERGGGVVPPGASCNPGVDNPYGNGGISVFNVATPGNIRYALEPDGSNAIRIGKEEVPAATFCTVHVIEHIPDEQRIIVAYYSQGTKILDYFIDDNGRFVFRETASVIFSGANTWSAEQFKMVNHADGTRTYYFMSGDIQRGIDVFSWRGPRNPIGAAPPSGGTAATVGGVPLSGGDLGLLAAALVLLPAAALIGRRRRVVGRLGWSMFFRF